MAATGAAPTSVGAAKSIDGAGAGAAAALAVASAGAAVVATGATLVACGAWALAAAGVSPIAARAIAHPNSFIITPIDSVAKKGPPMAGRSEFGGLIGGTFQSLKRRLRGKRRKPISGREPTGDLRDR